MAGSWISDVIQLRLPLKPEYLPVLRATVGVIAGNMDFEYDEIMQLRVAVSEAFDLANKRAAGQGRTSEANELAVRFKPQPDRLEIEITSPTGLVGDPNDEDEEESLALLESVMDSVEFRAENREVYMVKHKSAREQT